MAWHGGLQIQFWASPCGQAGVTAAIKAAHYQWWSVSERNPRAGNNNATIMQHRERWIQTGDRISWFMKCELGAESMRPRWGWWGGGVRMAQTAVCVVEAGDTATTPKNHHHQHYALTPSLFAHSQESLQRRPLICRNPARSPHGPTATR